MKWLPCSYRLLLALRGRNADCIDQHFERLDQCWHPRAHLISVCDAQPSQEARAVGRDAQQDLAPILRATAALEQPALYRTLHQLHGAVVAKLQAFREHADTRAQAGWQALQGEQ